MQALPALLLLVVCACGQHRDAPASTPPSGSAAPATGTAPAAGSSGIVPDAIRARVCSAEPCGGDQSSINVYRDAAGAVKKLYRLYGGCSHNPGIYFDPDGTQTELIPEEPIVPGSDEAKQLEARHQAQVGGLTMTDVIRCRDGARLPPR